MHTRKNCCEMVINCSYEYFHQARCDVLPNPLMMIMNYRAICDQNPFFLILPNMKWWYSDIKKFAIFWKDFLNPDTLWVLNFFVERKEILWKKSNRLGSYSDLFSSLACLLITEFFFYIIFYCNKKHDKILVFPCIIQLLKWRLIVLITCRSNLNIVSGFIWVSYSYLFRKID